MYTLYFMDNKKLKKKKEKKKKKHSVVDTAQTIRRDDVNTSGLLKTLRSTKSGFAQVCCIFNKIQFVSSQLLELNNNANIKT